jgi:hypothetical protein
LGIPIAGHIGRDLSAGKRNPGSIHWRMMIANFVDDMCSASSESQMVPTAPSIRSERHRHSLGAILSSLLSESSFCYLVLPLIIGVRGHLMKVRGFFRKERLVTAGRSIVWSSAAIIGVHDRLDTKGDVMTSDMIF